MINKIGRWFRKLHRYMTPVFVVVTVWFMVINENPDVGATLGAIQKVLMLTLAFTGAFLFFQIYALVKNTRDFSRGMNSLFCLKGDKKKMVMHNKNKCLV